MSQRSARAYAPTRSETTSGLLATCLGSSGIRGICLVHSPLPIIVYGNESLTAQAFTLTHELGHILLQATGITGPRSARYRGKTVEGWCDRFSAAFLMPVEFIEMFFGQIPPRPHSEIADADLTRLAKMLGVSAHAMLVRLVQLKYVKASYYWEVKKAQFDLEDGRFKQFGRAKYYGSRYRSSFGDLYTGLVIEAWSTGRIDRHNAAEYLGIKNPSHLQDIRDRFADK